MNNNTIAGRLSLFGSPRLAGVRDTEAESSGQSSGVGMQTLASIRLHSESGQCPASCSEKPNFILLSGKFFRSTDLPPGRPSFHNERLAC